MHVGKINNYSYRPNFTRRLDKDEEAEYTKTLNDAKKYLGVKNLSMILHGSCYPVDTFDTGIGSPISKSAEDMLAFEKLHGFNGNQLGPMGEISRWSISPYSGTVFAKNHLFIDLKALTTDKYANILSKETFNNLLMPSENEVDGENYTYSRFFDAFENYDIAIKEAYSNFKEKAEFGDPTALQLDKEFTEFKKQKGEQSLNEGLFQVLTHTYGTMDTDVWENDIDKNLIELLKQRNPQAIARFEQILERSKDELDAYIFGQFLVDKQTKENKEWREGENFKYINDLLVGFSPSEEWMHRDAFLKDYRLGCPDGGHLGPQLWDIPVIDPKKLFNADGSLGVAGQLLKDKIEAAFESCESVRVDHALGLVDPYVYNKNSVVISNGYLDRGRFNAANISSRPDLDPNGDYKKILEKILLPILEEHGLAPEEAVWEDLGNQTGTFRDVYFNKLHLPGITQLEWSRAEDSPRKNTALVGSHDSAPANEMIKRDYIRNSNGAWGIDYLTGYLNANPERANEAQEFKQEIINDPLAHVRAKFMDLFRAADNLQISFADFFGIDKTYNVGGTESKDNWKLRLNKDYQDTYYKNLESERPTALNMPEILKGAVQAKLDLDTVRGYTKNNPQQAEELIKKLNKFSNILKEKTDSDDSLDITV